MSTDRAFAKTSTEIKPGDRIVFLGDSITQSGVRPGGYVSIVEHAIREQFDLGEIAVIGAGISGNKISQCLDRVETDVIDHQPTHVVVYAGVNDVWKTTQGQGTPIDEFESNLTELIRRLTTDHCTVFVCTPALIGERIEPPNSLDALLEKYCDVVRQVANRMDAHLIDLRQSCIDYLRKNNRDNKSHSVLTTDGVHLNSTGNRFVARCICAALNIETSRQPSKVLRHLLLFRFATPANDPKVSGFLDSLQRCVQQNDLILNFELGTNVSSQQKSRGFTHIASMTFADEAERGVFLGDAQFVNLISDSSQLIEDLLIFDYWMQKS